MNVNALSAPAIELLQKMREMATQAANQTAPTAPNANSIIEQINGTAKVGQPFAATLTDAVNQVNQLQITADTLKEAYTRGDDKVSLAQASLAAQKADIAFTALVNVRNKFTEAYTAIMNMNI